MLFFVLTFALLGAASYVVGVSVGSLLGALSPRYRLGDYWLCATWLGLLTLGNALLALALLTPLTPLCGAALTLALCLPALANGGCRLRWSELRQAARERPSELLAIALLVVSVGAFFNRPSYVIDAGVYHIGSIEWLSRTAWCRGWHC